MARSTLRPAAPWTHATILVALVLTGCTTLAAAAAGDLDASFGAGGTVITDFGGGNDNAQGVAIQADGKIVAVGTAGNDFALARYCPDGQLDDGTHCGAGGFGSGGKVTTNFGVEEKGMAVAIQADGKIVVAGTKSTLDVPPSQVDFALARYCPDGRLDDGERCGAGGFGSDGIVTTSFGAPARAKGLAIQADGRIVVVGNKQVGASNDFAVARYCPDGRLDDGASCGAGGFGSGGKVTTDLGGNDVANSVALQGSPQRIVVAGASGTDFALARYLAGGTLDTAGFGTGGKVITDIGATDIGHSVAIQSDEKVVLAGTSATTGMNATSSIAVARYAANGVLDAGFGTGGKVTTGFIDKLARGLALAIQADGKLVVAGEAGSAAATNDFAVVRYCSDGRLDDGASCGPGGFGSGGKVTTDLGGSDTGNAVALQPDTKIVVAGLANTGGNSDFDFALARYLALATPTSTPTPTFTPSSTSTATSTLTSTATRTATATAIPTPSLTVTSAPSPTATSALTATATWTATAPATPTATATSIATTPVVTSTATPTENGRTATPTPTGTLRTPTATSMPRTPTPTGTLHTPTPTGTFRSPTPTVTGTLRTPTPTGTSRTPTATSATPSCPAPADVGLVVHAVNEAQKAQLEAVLTVHRTAWQQQSGRTLVYRVYGPADDARQPYREWLKSAMVNGFAGPGFCATSFVIGASFDDLAVLRDGLVALDGFIAGGGMQPADFLPTAWALTRMPQGGAEVGVALPWLRAGCVESYTNLAIPRASAGAPATAYSLVDFLVREPAQRVNFENPAAIAANGARLAYPTLREPYAAGGWVPPPCASFALPAPDPRAVHDAVGIAGIAAQYLAKVWHDRKADDYSDGPDVAEVLYVTPGKGTAATGTSGVGTLGEGMSDMETSDWVQIAAVKADVRVPIDGAAMDAYLARPEGMLVGQISLYAPGSVPLTPTPVPTAVPWPNRIYLPWSELAWQATRPNPYRFYAVLWESQGGERRLRLVRPDGSEADAAAAAAETGLDLAFEAPIPSESTVAAVCSEEPGSKKICWKVDRVKGCITIK